MSTKVKVGIAAVIVSALIALIVLDQKTTPKDGAPPGASEPAARDAKGTAESDGLIIFDRAKDQFLSPAPTPKAEKLPQEPSIKEIRPGPAALEEYTIKEGDRLADIAQAKLGNAALWPEIVKANPGLRAIALRAGRKIVIPPKPEKKAEPEKAAALEPAPAADPGAAPRIYVVQPGDTLSGISKKLYNTVRHTDKIFEANRDKLENPHDLRVGMKLALPEGLSKSEGAVPAVATALTGAAFTPAAAAASRIHEVQPEESLWKIAEKYCGERGIEEMMEAIRKANADKLKDRSLLRVGWKLVIPE